MVGRVEKQRVPPRLRFFGETETAVCVYVYGPDRVHLKSDFHGSILIVAVLMAKRDAQCNAQRTEQSKP
jgi:hypothetical protein